MQNAPGAVRAPRRARFTAFVSLAVISGKDMLRNRLSGLSMIVMFVTLLVLYFAMWLAFATLGPAPVASVTPANPQLTRALQQAGVTVGGANAAARNTEITVTGDTVLAVFDSDTKPAWNPVWLGLRDAGFTTDAITLVNDEGEVRVDFLRMNLGIVAMGGIAGLAFIGTAVPIAGMRERGLLRLLGTTPLRRSTLLLAQIPARLVIACVMSAIVMAVALWRRYLDGIDVLSFAITLTIGGAMLFAVALLFAARSRNEEATQSGMAMLPILLVFAAGGIVPASMLPGVPEILMNALPTSWFAAALSADLIGTAPFFPVPLLWAMMAAVTCIAFIWAAKRFEWDQSDPRQRRGVSRATTTSRKATS